MYVHQMVVKTYAYPLTNIPMLETKTNFNLNNDKKTMTYYDNNMVPIIICYKIAFSFLHFFNYHYFSIFSINYSQFRNIISLYLKLILHCDYRCTTLLRIETTINSNSLTHSSSKLYHQLLMKTYFLIQFICENHRNFSLIHYITRKILLHHNYK